MKIRTKLVLEVIVLFALVGMISFVSIMNTKQLQDSFSSISSETLPVLDTLKDMRYASTQLSAITMEIVLIEDETRNTGENEYRELEEILEINFYKIEQAKSLFNDSFSKYSNLMIENYDDEINTTEELAAKWNDLLFISNKMIQLKTSGVSGLQILQLNQDFNSSFDKMNAEIDHAIELTSGNIDQRQEYIDLLVTEVTWSIVIALNLFVLTALVIRFLILRSISNPLNKIRKVTHSIAKGDFVLYPEKGNDEISELGRDINIMSNDLAELHKKIIEKERLSSIGSLATRFAHDIRNPLSVIKNSFEIIEIKTKNTLDDSLLKNFERIGRAVERITHQTDDVLDYVSVTEVKREKCSLLSIIKSTIKNNKIPYGVKISIPDNDCMILCDPYKLEIILTNLVNNACYAINDDGKIIFRIIETDDDVIIEVEDSGKGIPDDDLDKIFEPLFTTKQTGTGLGLSSCKSIIDAHEGKISVRNNPTTFSIQFPKKPKNYQIPIKKEHAKSRSKFASTE
ncbi:MAG: MCP four helix bundle domain-containing protein [Nitrosopumilus sp.]|nr:MCP four helix bundle domain-containing protein [Nitrosopumilus sp.]